MCIRGDRGLVSRPFGTLSSRSLAPSRPYSSRLSSRCATWPKGSSNSRHERGQERDPESALPPPCILSCCIRFVWKVGALSGHNFECLQDSRGLSRQTDGRVARSGVRHEIDVWRHEHIRLAKYVLRCGAPIHELAGSRQQPLSTACTVRRHGVPGHPPWSHHVSVKPPVYE